MKKIIALLLTVIILATFALFAVGSSDDTTTVSGDTDESTTAATAEEKDLTVNEGEVLTAGNLKITYVSSGEYKGYSQYFPPKDGYKFIYIDLKAENTGETDVIISTFEFNCYADDVAMEAHYEEDDISATLSKGRSTTGKVYFEVPINAEKIEIEYETDFWADEKAVFVVK